MRNQCGTPDKSTHTPRIVRSELVEVANLGHRRTELEGPLVDVFLDSFDVADRDVLVRKAIFRDPEAKLELLWGEHDELLGFISVGWTRMELGGRAHWVMDTGVYMRAGVTGQGDRVGRRTLLEALRMRLRHPFASLSFVGEMVSPVSYRRAVLTWPEVYPHREREADPHTEALLREVMARRGFGLVRGIRGA